MRPRGRARSPSRARASRRSRNGVELHEAEEVKLRPSATLPRSRAARHGAGGRAPSARAPLRRQLFDPATHAARTMYRGAARKSSKRSHAQGTRSEPAETPDNDHRDAPRRRRTYDAGARGETPPGPSRQPATLSCRRAGAQPRNPKMRLSEYTTGLGRPPGPTPARRR